MKCLFSISAATAVVPEPMVASKITPPPDGVKLIFVAMYGLLDNDRARMLLVLIRGVYSANLAIA